MHLEIAMGHQEVGLELMSPGGHDLHAHITDPSPPHVLHKPYIFSHQLGCVV
jgi:hypothetical protein